MQPYPQGVGESSHRPTSAAIAVCCNPEAHPDTAPLKQKFVRWFILHLPLPLVGTAGNQRELPAGPSLPTTEICYGHTKSTGRGKGRGMPGFGADDT